MAIDQSLLLLA